MIISDVQIVNSAVIATSTNQQEDLNTKKASINSDFPMCQDKDDYCVQREIHKQQRIKEVKKQILKALNLVSPPNISKNELPSDLTIRSMMKNHGIEKIRKEIDKEHEGLTLKKTQIIKVAEINSNYSNGSQFSFVKTDQNLDIRRAHLMVYILPNNYRNIPTIAYINISVISLHSGIIQRNITYSINIQTSRGYWKKIDLTSLLIEILSHQTSLSNIFLSTNTNEVEVKRDNNNLSFAPYIDLVTQSKKRQSKRSLTPRECFGPHKDLHCCNYELYILFKEIEWNWVIYPDGFDARYCTGTCGFAHTRTNTRSKIISHLPSLSSNQTNSCCSPSEMQSVKVLYQSPGGIKFNVIDSLKINQCDCL